MLNQPTLTYEERNALAVIRSAIKNKPQLAALILQNMSKEAAAAVLKQAQKELNDLLAMNRAFSKAAASLAEAMPKEETSC